MFVLCVFVTASALTNPAVAQCLSGTYTIGGASPSYATIGAAITALKTSGICGPVVFNIRSGTYSGQINLTNIPGTNSTRTVTFKSEKNNADSVIITHNDNDYVWMFSNASYITLKNLTVKTAGNAVVDFWWQDTVSYAVIDSCKLIGHADCFANLYTYGSVGKRNIFTNNLFQTSSYAAITYGGYQNASFPSDSFVFRKNRIVDFSDRGLELSFMPNVLVDSNFFTSTGGTAMVLSNLLGDYRVINNQILLPKGGTGMYLSALNVGIAGAVSTTNTSLIANNIISASVGIYFATSYYQNILNNSIYVFGSGGSGFTYAPPGYTGGPVGHHNRIMNNIFCNNGTGVAMTQRILPPGTNQFDYNLLYAKGPSLVTSDLLGSFSDIASWKAGSGLDSNSVSYRPAFTDTVTLAPNPADSAAWAMNGRGVQIPGDTIDINGNRRPDTVTAGVPDLGAYEFTPTSIPPAAIAYPAVATPGSRQSFVFAGDTVANITWGTASAIPANIKVRQYSGEIPPQYSTTSPHMFFYTDIADTGSQAYSYTAETFYRKTWLGTNPAESRLKLQRKVSAAQWKTLGGTASAVDTIRKVLTAADLTDFTLHTGTDSCNAQPERITGDTAVCEGQSYTYSVPAIGCATTYDWTLPGGWSGSSASNTITVTPSDTGGTITMAANLPYGGSVTQTLTVTAYPRPAATVGYTGGVLSTGTFSSYQWYHDGQTIPNATAQSYTPAANGDYYVSVTDAHGCSNSSDTLTVTDIVGIAATARGASLHIYPNPARDWFIIDNKQEETVSSIHIYNSIGAVVYVNNHEQRSRQIKVPLNQLADGMYMLSIRTANGNHAVQLHVLR